MSLVRLNLAKDETASTSEPLWINPDNVEFVMRHPRHSDRSIVFLWGSGKTFELMHSADDAVERLTQGRVRLT